MSVAVLGEALIDLIVGDDGAYRPHLGGSPYNVAIGLARQGIRVSYLSPFSDDAFGERLLQSLRSEGVETPTNTEPVELCRTTARVTQAPVPSARLSHGG